MKTFVPDFNNKVHIDLFRIKVLYEIISSLSCSTCCEQIIVDQNYIIFIDGVEVHLNSIYPILF